MTGDNNEFYSQIWSSKETVVARRLQCVDYRFTYFKGALSVGLPSLVRFFRLSHVLQVWH